MEGRWWKGRKVVGGEGKEGMGKEGEMKGRGGWPSTKGGKGGWRGVRGENGGM